MFKTSKSGFFARVLGKEKSDLTMTSLNLNSLYLSSMGGVPTELNYFEEYSYTATWDVSASTTTSTIYLRRIGNTVWISLGVLVHTLTGGASTFVLQSASYLPTRFRPYTNTIFQIPIRENSTDLDTPGAFICNNTGQIIFYKNMTGGSFSTGQCGTGAARIAPFCCYSKV